MAPNYNQQILALVAAAGLDYQALTPICYGCTATYISSGIYKIILPTGLGVDQAQSFIRVTAKSDPNNGSPVGVALTVTEESDTIKTVLVTSNNGGGPTTSAIEIVVMRSVTPEG